MPSCTPIHRCILEQEAEGGFTASALQYEPRPPFLQTAFTVMRLLLATTLLHQGHTHEQLATQVYMSLPLLHNSGTSAAPIPHTHTKCLSILYASFIPRPHQLSVTWGEPGNKVEATWSYKR